MMTLSIRDANVDQLLSSGAKIVVSKPIKKERALKIVGGMFLLTHCVYVFVGFSSAYGIVAVAHWGCRRILSIFGLNY